MKIRLSLWKKGRYEMAVCCCWWIDLQSSYVINVHLSRLIFLGHLEVLLALERLYRTFAN
jgi:hypothetical protein